MDPADTHAVGLKLPVFLADHPRVWLQQAEEQFAVRNVTADNTKYHYVVAALEQATALRDIDVLEDPPQHNKYDNLKRRRHFRVVTAATGRSTARHRST